MEITPNYPYWPESLGNPALDSLQEEKPSNTSSITPQNKTKIVRKNSTRIQTSVSLEFYFTATQLQKFKDFWENDISGGSGLFWFIDPITKNYRITGFDPSQETSYSTSTNGSMDYFVVTCKFLYWE